MKHGGPGTAGPPFTCPVRPRSPRLSGRTECERTGCVGRMLLCPHCLSAPPGSSGAGGLRRPPRRLTAPGHIGPRSPGSGPCLHTALLPPGLMFSHHFMPWLTSLATPKSKTSAQSLTKAHIGSLPLEPGSGLTWLSAWLTAVVSPQPGSLARAEVTPAAGRRRENDKTGWGLHSRKILCLGPGDRQQILQGLGCPTRDTHRGVVLAPLTWRVCSRPELPELQFGTRLFGLTAQRGR